MLEGYSFFRVDCNGRHKVKEQFVWIACNIQLIFLPWHLPEFVFFHLVRWSLKYVFVIWTIRVCFWWSAEISDWKTYVVGSNVFLSPWEHCLRKRGLSVFCFQFRLLAVTCAEVTNNASVKVWMFGFRSNPLDPRRFSGPVYNTLLSRAAWKSVCPLTQNLESMFKFVIFGEAVCPYF